MTEQTKLDKILQLRRLKENETAAALARTRDVRVSAEDKSAELAEITGQYRDKHTGQQTFSPFLLRQFREFYGQLNKAAHLQNMELERARQAENTVLAHFHGHYLERRALESLIAQRELTHKYEEKKAQRKSQRASRKGPLG
ncbi:MAG: hypothetical protein AAF993_03890 [Pseudomonadota bacterium]